MIRKKVLDPERVRHIEKGFSFIPHRFLTDGFLASDRQGLSFYSYETICSLLQLPVDDYLRARDGLLEKDLIAFDGTLFQVLDLPPQPLGSRRELSRENRIRQEAPSGR